VKGVDRGRKKGGKHDDETQERSRFRVNRRTQTTTSETTRRGVPAEFCQQRIGHAMPLSLLFKPNHFGQHRVAGTEDLLGHSLKTTSGLTFVPFSGFGDNFKAGKGPGAQAASGFVLDMPVVYPPFHKKLPCSSMRKRTK
jgi:hypothetical protein